jgi:hypothetical protein
LAGNGWRRPPAVANPVSERRRIEIHQIEGRLSPLDPASDRIPGIE